MTQIPLNTSTYGKWWTQTKYGRILWDIPLVTELENKRQLVCHRFVFHICYATNRNFSWFHSTELFTLLFIITLHALELVPIINTLTEKPERIRNTIKKKSFAKRRKRYISKWHYFPKSWLRANSLMNAIRVKDSVLIFPHRKYTRFVFFLSPSM